MNKNQRAYRIKMQKARVEFLRKHPELWEGHSVLTDTDRKFIVEEMKKAGCVSKKTYWADVRIEKTIAEFKHAKVLSNG